MAQHRDVYAEITKLIIDRLEQGDIPWQRPWASGRAANLVSKRPYNGLNAVLLSTAPFGSRWWLTFNQAKALGGHIKKGSKGLPIIFWKFLPKTNDEGEVTGQFPILRSWTVFNVEQTEGIEYPKDDSRIIQPIQAADYVIAAMPNRPDIIHGSGDSAAYSLRHDRIVMPQRNKFKSEEGYYSTLFHELVHSTGHATRIGREGVMNFDRFGSERYSKEELIAELGAAMLAGVAGIAPNVIDNSAAYIANWLSALRNDKKLVLTAASEAQKAADYILNEQAREEEEAA